jgi:hypothetical protein
MFTPSDSTLYILSFDIDGTLTGPDYSIYGIFGIYETLLRELQQISGIEVILNSGKPFHVLSANAARFGGRYIIASNGAAYQALGSERVVFGGGSEDLVMLRALLGLSPHDEGVKEIQLDGASYEVVVEEDEYHDTVLCLFSEPEWVSHRWTFKGGIDRMTLYLHLRNLIADHHLKLHVLQPHGDGAVDVVRIHNEKPIDKSTLPDMVDTIWPDVPNIRIAMFGDGSNDVPAMTATGVLGVTFSESDEARVIAPVLRHRGIVTSLPAWVKHANGGYQTGGGVIEGVKILAERGFFDHKKQKVLKLCERAFKKMSSEASSELIGLEL